MEKNDKHFFYVLSCKDGSFYGGYTNNLARRIKLHNEGNGAKYTRGRGPVTLLYYQTFSNKTDALKAEYEFKKKSRKNKEEFLIIVNGGYYVAAKEL